MPRARHALAGCQPAADAGSLDAEEYLDRCGVTAYMKDCVTLLLENRPDEPLTFMGDYFRTVTQPSSPLLRAYRYIRLTPLDRPAFPDNLVAAYAALDSQRGTNGVTGAELQRLLGASVAGLHSMKDEHFGISVVEYMAAGAIPIAHNSAGPRMDIVTKETGYLVETAEQCAAAMAAVLGMSESDRVAMAALGRRRAELFTQERFQQGFLGALLSGIS